MNKKDFIKGIKYNLKLQNFTIKLIHKKVAKCVTGICSGYFSIGTRELVIATGNSKWFETLLHEYCHFCQFVEESKVYRNYCLAKGKWHAWANKTVEIENKDKRWHFIAVRNLELDCERRVIKLIKKYNLPVDINDYCRKANVYLFDYKYRDLTRTPLRFINNFSKLHSIIPAKLLRNKDYDKLPKKYKKLLEN